MEDVVNTTPVISKAFPGTHLKPGPPESSDQFFKCLHQCGFELIATGPVGKHPSHSANFDSSRLYNISAGHIVHLPDDRLQKNIILW